MHNPINRGPYSSLKERCVLPLGSLKGAALLDARGEREESMGTGEEGEERPY